jgi:hypothetical protein
MNWPSLFVEFSQIISILRTDIVPISNMECISGVAFYQRFLVTMLVPPARPCHWLSALLGTQLDDCAPAI